jgi:RNA polymerase sigma factor (sigma-70 family)
MTLKEFLDRFNQEGSHKISGEVYTQCRYACVGWLLKQGYVNDVNDAKDIFADAILILINNAERGRIEATSTQVLTYLTTICRNTQSNLSKRKDKASEWELDKIIEDIAEENTEGAIEKEALLVRIENTLASLQDPCASLFKLYYYEGFSHREIAVSQGYASESVSKSMMYKCKAAFGKLFGNLT